MDSAKRRKGQPWSNTAMKEKDARRPPPPQFHQRAASVSKTPFRENQQEKSVAKPGKKVPVCYLCGQEGHTKPVCPRNPLNLTQMCFVPRETVDLKPEKGLSAKMAVVKINGKKIKALIDTGSTQTLVHRQYVPNNKVCTFETIPICCVHGDEKLYPTADIFIEVQGQSYLLNVGVADNLQFPVVLGEDLPVLYDLLKPVHNCNVVTRAQAKQNEHLPSLSALPFFDADLETNAGKSRKSRSQRRQEKFKHTEVKPQVEDAPEVPLGFKIPSNIMELQQNDPSLSAILLRARGGESEVEPGSSKEEYFLQNGILYHQHGQTKRLVVPESARDVVLTLGHSVPWAGHLGKHKTTARIRRHFHWPGLRSDVIQFCRSCPQCQKTSARGPSRAPLQPLPVIGTPFERLGMDIVGPVEKSKAGNRYMLVITDYATKYPEVFPLKSVYKLLGIRGMRTTPYHPQTDGLTERFNQTLKQMLRKFVDDTGSDWDQWLPYLLFAYREVPQASTGFSPFELLYGHEVRGASDFAEGNMGRRTGQG
ncbi:uncharacterized protein LOC121639280 [Melanotaenia boesemani]|uniref:uncharacterized protein LOC121639280 n=1 Tax=Melanotaenia boesemani TaxID=1250792 RepID=UPI001C042E21|nr:uncharacterized protein LOC121639280 [Melanotaenia boesemani]